MANSNSKTSRFANLGALLSSKKNLLPPPALVEERRHNSAAMIESDCGENHGFGAEENDWLGAEAYVDPLR